MNNVPEWCFAICGAIAPLWLLGLVMLYRMIANAPVVDGDA